MKEPGPSQAPQLLADATVHGPKTKMTGVQAARVEYRPWLARFPTCPVLNQYQIAHVGRIRAMAPYQIVRTKQTSTYFLACFGGSGEVLIDGRWRVCRAGYACFLPAHTLNAFRAVPGVAWEFCWVCYSRPADQQSVSGEASPVLARFEAWPLFWAIQGLEFECSHDENPSVIQHWVELIQSYVLRFAQPEQLDERMVQLWERVANRLPENWNLARLANESGYSKEHLRRLCRRHLGRSPMHHVIYLRMRQAAELLLSTDLKIEAVAEAVGYKNPFVFSNAFTKWVGRRPSEYRRTAKRTDQIGPPSVG